MDGWMIVLLVGASDAHVMGLASQMICTLIHNFLMYMNWWLILLM
jgi:hypothetical protein